MAFAEVVFMIHDYGYMEDGKLGKPYDLHLLKRLLGYARPYKRGLVLALFFSLLITLCDLAIPYFSKVAIDRFIVPSWYMVHVENPASAPGRGFFTKYEGILVQSKDQSFYLISNRDIKKLDPSDLHKLRISGLISPKRFYRIPSSVPITTLPLDIQEKVLTMKDGSHILSLEQMKGLPPTALAIVRSKDLRGLTLVGTVLLGLILLSFGLSYAEYYLLEYTGQHMMQDIRVKLFQNIQGQSVGFFGKHPLGRLVTRVTNDVENLNEMFKSVVITLFKDFFILLGILVVLFYMNRALALICLLLLPIISFLTFLFSTMAREAFRELRAKVAKINAFLQERLSTMQLIQLFCAEKAQLEHFKKINHENFLAGMKQIRIFAVFMPMMELLSSFGVALIIWYGGGRVIQDRLTLGALVAFISYIQMFFKPIRDISEKYNIMQSAMASTERIFQFMDYQEVIPEPEAPVVPDDIKGHLIVKDVTFSYDGTQPVLHDLSFELKPGQTIGIVGHTGSGKTTIVNLLLRLYDPDRGAIYLDGVDFRNWPTQMLRKHMAPVMQDVFIFAGEFEENITLGRESVSSKVVQETLKVTNLDRLLKRLPQGLHQPIGERGATLSAGERQLLSFARALASKPRILILDEATSNVDPDTEELIQDAISQITIKQTTLIIAHRLSTVRNADHILVLHQGRIREQGTHQELMALRGIYYRLNQLQEK
ncbi:MAG: ABC transporter ATP-binding protein [Deltaproteobacteria bacterium]|nr:ABC transporter ATP-binding protein [Deltaproteobacteria bacterium]MBW1928015.1 ABC transporter ATP-binding protein [Deltaproteobacteria bacterium]